MKSDISEEKDFFGHTWWKWTEICDRCGLEIFNQSTHSCKTKPDTDEADFCVSCLHALANSGISYETAKRRYKLERCEECEENKEIKHA